MIDLDSMPDDEFEQLLNSIDDELSKANVPIPHRQLRAVMLVANRLQVDLVVAPARSKRRDDRQFVQRIWDWYKQKYGDLIKMNLLIGAVALLLKDNIWVMSIPHVVQHARFYTEPTEPPVQALGQMLNGGRYNIIDYIRSMPMPIRKALDPSELIYILDLFVLGLNLYSGLREITKKAKLPMIKQANIDFDTCVYHLQPLHMNFGQSKWSSLQATEKMYKAYLAHKGRTYRYVHNLLEFDKQLDGIEGRPTIDSADLTAIQVAAGVRYGDIQVERAEAVNAHHASLRVGDAIARGIRSQDGSYFVTAPL